MAKPDSDLAQAVLEEGLFQPGAPPPADEGKKQAAVGGGGTYGLTTGLPEVKPATTVVPGLEVVPTDAGPAGANLPAERGRYARGTTSKAFAEARGIGQQPSREVLAGQAFTGDYDGIYTVEEHKQAQEPGVLEQIYRVFEPLDDPRRALWLMFYEGASLLPDTREGGIDPSMPLDKVWETANGTTVGDSLAWLTAKAGAGQLEREVNDIFGTGFGPSYERMMGMALPDQSPEEIYLEHEIGWRMEAPAPLATPKPLADEEIYERLASEWYSTLSSGALADKAWNEQDTEAFWFYGVGGGAGWRLLGAERAPHPRGVHIFDEMITKDEAMLMADTAQTPALRNLGYVLSSDLGREVLGAGLEIAVDPLWFAGPAKAAEVVSAAGRTYQIGKPMVKAVGAMEKVPLGGGFRTVAELREVVVKSVPGVTSTEEMVKARELMVEAMELANGKSMMAVEDARLAQAALQGGDAVAEATTVLRGQMAVVQGYIDAAKQMGRADEALRQTNNMLRLQKDMQRVTQSADEAMKFLRGVAKQEALTAKAFAGYADDINRALLLGDKARETGLVAEKGTIAWHVPFGTSTQYVFKPGAGGAMANRVKLLTPEPILNAGAAAVDVLAPFTKTGINTRIEQIARTTGLPLHEAVHQLSAAEQLAFAFQTVLGRASNLPKFAFTEMNRWFGSRFIQPLVTMAKTETQAAQLGARGAVIAKVPGLNRWIASMQRAEPEVWDNYMGALTAYMNRIDSLEGTLRIDMDRLVGEAKLAHKARKRMAKNMLPTVERQIEEARKLQVPGDDAGRRHLRALEDRAEQMRMWSSKSYTVEDVLIDAGAHIEQGSGALAAYPELMPYAQASRELVQKYADLTQQERGLVANALANIQRFAEGDPTKATVMQEEMTRLMSMMNSMDASNNALLDQSRRAAASELSRLASARTLFNNISRDKLVEAMEIIMASEGGKPISQVSAQSIVNIIKDVFRDDPDAVRDVLSNAAILMKDEDTARGMLGLIHMLEPDINLLMAERRAVGGTTRTAKSLRMSVARYLDAMDEQAAGLRKVFTDGFTDEIVLVGNRIITKGTPISVVKSMLLEQSNTVFAKAKSIVGGNDWPAFMEWWRTVRARQPNLPPAWTEGAAQMDRAALLRRAAMNAESMGTSIKPPVASVPETAGLELARRLPAGIKAEDVAKKAESVRGAAKGSISEELLLSERMRQLVSSAATDEEAAAKIKRALYEIMGGWDPAVTKPALVDRAVDAMAKRLVKPLRGGLPLETAQALREGRGAARAAIDAAQQRVLDVRTSTEQNVAKLSEEWTARLEPQIEAAKAGLTESTPRIPLKPKMERPALELPDELADDQAWAALEKWESDMWSDFQTITDGLSDRERLMVAFSSLSEMPQILRPEMRKSIEALYPSAMGQRLGEVPTEMEPVVARMRQLIEGYEKLYEKHGMQFMKSPEEMLRVWGVAGYVPHVPTSQSLLAVGGAQEYVGAVAAGYKTAASRGGVEGALSMKMDARKLRQIDGTIAEINAMRRDLDMVMTLDPMAVLGRYGQANQAISAKEFMLTMMRGGVVKALRSEDQAAGLRKSMAMVAAEQDMIPLLERKINALEEELLFTGNREAWMAAGVQPDELMRTIRSTVAGDKEGLFATWFEEIPELGALRKVEDFYTELRAREYFAGKELSDVSTLRQMGMEWDAIATTLNERAMQADRAWASTTKIDGKALEQFFGDGQEAWRLYIPRVVAESMKDVFGTSSFEKAIKDSKIYQYGMALNTFWKTRVTVISLAFSMRNAMSNVVSTFLDVGAGALNPRTNTRAGFLTQALLFQEKYGSIEEAARILSGPLPEKALSLLPPVKRAGVVAKHKAAQETFDMLFDKAPRLFGDESWLKTGIDLGDGLVRSLDEALNLMRENGVTSQAFTQMTDIGSTERHLLEAIQYGKGFGTSALRVASAAEDMIVVAWPALMTASGGLPLLLGLPKKFGGEVISRGIENQARIVSFIGNLKRSGSVGTAAEHVQKFLFNYGDLTGVQKSVMRLVFPFFTWNQKNMMLQLELMQKSPVLYSQFWRLLMEDGPRIVEAYNSQYFDRPYAPPQPGTMREQVTQEPHRLGAVRLPVPTMDDTYITGFGLPQEAFVEKVGLMQGMIDPNNWGGPRQYENRRRALRILGETHFLLRFMAESAFQHHSFYDRPINELTNGRLIAQSTAPLGMFGPPGEMMQAYMNDALGLHISATWDSGTQTYTPDPIIEGRVNHIYGSAPWTRVVRDASALTNTYAVSLASDPATAARLGLSGTYQEVPTWIRLADALSGIRVVQYDPALQDSLRVWRLNEAVRENLRQREAVRDYATDYISREPTK